MQDLFSQPWIQDSLPWATFIFCVASGIIPVANAELFVIGIAPFIKNEEQLLFIGFSAALGQMISKTILYMLSQKALDFSFFGRKMSPRKIKAWHQKVEKWGWKVPLFTFVSAFLGFPPFLILSCVLGMVRANLLVFVLTGMVGRTLRFVLLLKTPDLFSNVFAHAKESFSKLL